MPHPTATSTNLLRLAKIWLIWAIVGPLAFAGCAEKTSRGDKAAQDIAVTDHGTMIVSVDLIEIILDVHATIGRSAGVEAALQLLPDPEPNAFVTLIEGRPVILLTRGIMEMIGRQKGYYAFLFAHEYAHLKQGHFAAQLNRDEKMGRVGGAIIGGLEVLGMAIGVPLGLFSILSVDSGSQLVALKYDRDQEREADSVAIAIMEHAGYDPRDALSFQQELTEKAGSAAIPFLSTHPSGEERIGLIRAVLRSKGRLDEKSP